MPGGHPRQPSRPLRAAATPVLSLAVPLGQAALPPPQRAGSGSQGSGQRMPVVMSVPLGPDAGGAAWWGVPPPGPAELSQPQPKGLSALGR